MAGEQHQQADIGRRRPVQLHLAERRLGQKKRQHRQRQAPQQSLFRRARRTSQFVHQRYGHQRRQRQKLSAQKLHKMAQVGAPAADLGYSQHMALTVPEHDPVVASIPQEHRTHHQQRQRRAGPRRPAAQFLAAPRSRQQAESQKKRQHGDTRLGQAT